jgi:hypothetical protein
MAQDPQLIVDLVRYRAFFPPPHLELGDVAGPQLVERHIPHKLSKQSGSVHAASRGEFKGKKAGTIL